MTPSDSDAIAALRSEARRLFQAGLDAADPFDATRSALRSHPLPAARQRFLIAAGKAAVSMAEAALTGDWDAALVVTDGGNARPVAGAEVVEAGHPLPDAAGLAAAERVLAMAGSAGPEDLVLFLVSGGASAMLPAPMEGLTLDDKIAVHRLLLSAGFPIGDANLVRQALSRLKGGGLARAAAPARLVCLAVSDVPGDDPRIIGSGPAAAPLGSPAEALRCVRARGCADRLPQAALDLLAAAPAQQPTPDAEIHVIGSNAASVRAMAAAIGPERVCARDELHGDVAGAAERVAHAVSERLDGGEVPAALLWGGETTVEVTGDGEGGRNQELALRVALALQGRGGWVFLSGGSDGRDGPTDAAGGLVDGGSVGRMEAAGVDPREALARNDSGPALDAAGDRLVTGPTGTNVADLQVALIGR